MKYNPTLHLRLQPPLFPLGVAPLHLRSILPSALLFTSPSSSQRSLPGYEGFIRLVEEYTKVLKTSGCHCKPKFTPMGNNNIKIRGAITQRMCRRSSIRCTPYPCCKYDYLNRLKDGYKCGISHVMKYFFAASNCKCLGITTETKDAKTGEEKHKAEIQD